MKFRNPISFLNGLTNRRAVGLTEKRIDNPKATSFISDIFAMPIQEIPVAVS